MTAIDGNAGVTAPLGFRAAGIACGLKQSGRLDLAMVVNDGPSHVAAGVFTRNQVPAAPVRWSSQVLRDGKLRAVVLNSGNANSCTGAAGYQDTLDTAAKVADRLGVAMEDVGVCSTGVIGERLRLPTLLSGVDSVVDELGAGPGHDLAAATAVMTTDTVPKQTVLHTGEGWSVGGFSKGSGGIAPSMATTLSVLTTDAVVEPAVLDAALRRAVDLTFNRLDIDGSTSTNDCVIALSSGASGVEVGAEQLAEALLRVCDSLVRQLHADAEGVTKQITITVRGALTEDDAVTVGRAISRDNLLKAGFFGSDANWGRVIVPIGRSGVDIDPDRLDVTLNGVQVCKGSAPHADKSLVDLSGREIEVLVDLNLGGAEATVLTTDLSHQYVHMNSAYTT
ncbi:MAG TPA: bifunctional glutamate N-acetyltransferase/amino-acid acetyltransferase ArgJ [Actinophytocola sp.]|uniref:bifunctional glutamate N-acetyltransferase/amino-acid acetyltransferase ArgJ n=1 Tax=Actinophytocola sp. TaxID=1872138 RepID=UPI002DDCE5B5|nr:bifunctional glutamate N-acetyltransferase/amino-acid acetyltransferase ArgJ [Actinophytocola sp.]HEV2780518.1 bifunctional glutamate N-acetyltransferase/amino-acid acetyltransferase ArgJ [Actinophytocola sp.]